MDKNDKFVVSVNDTKTYIDRSFVIGSMLYETVKKYIVLRPPEQFTDKFFVQYLNGKCVRQVIRKNKIGSTPSIIASYLGLDNAAKYKGHCFRRTGATLLSNSGANMTMIKKLGGWRSDTVASGYIADAMRTKNLIFEGITSEGISATNTFFARPSMSNVNVQHFDSVSNTTDSSFNRPSTSKVINVSHFKGISNTDSSFDRPSTSKVINVPHFKGINNTDSSFDSFSTSKMKVSYPVMSESNQISFLNLTYEDFEDSTDKSNKENQTNGPIIESKIQSKNDLIQSTPFTNKSPVKLVFNKPPKKKMKIDAAKVDSSKKNDHKHLTNNENTHIVFENCTINGNII